jgi:hypothetical protein
MRRKCWDASSPGGYKGDPILKTDERIMSRNPQRGQAKALRRKKKLAERRKVGSSVAPRGRSAEARRYATLPVHACYVQAGLFQSGTGMVILVRGTGHSLMLASFLIDAFCLGVKDAMLRPIDKAELESLVEIFGAEAALEPADPAYARKLVRDAVAYARSIGLEPHADFAAAELLFGDISADDSAAEFEFGVDGKPVYIPGPGDTPRQIRQRLERLRRVLGDDGFGFTEMEEDFDEFEDDGYDPHIPPDPEEWLDLEDDERRIQIVDYHEREGIDPPPGGADVHAASHILVENRIVLGDEQPDGAAVERLMSQGLDRHEAIHAVAAVSFGVMRRIARGEEKGSPEAALNAAIEQMTAESWRRDFGPEEDEE